MGDNYLQNLFADRIGGKTYGQDTEIYKFEKIKRAKRAALAANPDADLIDLGVGEPDEMAFPDCVQALHQAAKLPHNRGYADNGGPLFKQAAARWLTNVFGLSGIDPETHILHSIGSRLIPILYGGDCKVSVNLCKYRRSIFWIPLKHRMVHTGVVSHDANDPRVHDLRGLRIVEGQPFEDDVRRRSSEQAL